MGREKLDEQADRGIEIVEKKRVSNTIVAFMEI